MDERKEDFSEKPLNAIWTIHSETGERALYDRLSGKKLAVERNGIWLAPDQLGGADVL